MKVFLRKFKALITGDVPCSFESAHGHDLAVPSINNGGDWATFQCIRCGKKMTYVKWLDAFI